MSYLSVELEKKAGLLLLTGINSIAEMMGKKHKCTKYKNQVKQQIDTKEREEKVRKKLPLQKTSPELRKWSQGQVVQCRGE